MVHGVVHEVAHGVARRYRHPVPQKYLSVDGVATFVHHRGPTTLPGHPPDLSGGQVVGCLHGAGGNGNEFSGVLDALEGSFTPIAYDQPGHGRSGGLDSLGSIEAMAAHLRGVAATLGIEKPCLFGDGMGAAVALEASIADRSFPLALVLTGGATAHADVSDDIIEQLRRVAEGKDRRNFDASGYAPGTPREIYQRAFAEWLKTDPRVTLGDRKAEQVWDGRGRLGAVSAPALIVLGAHEEPEARKSAEALAGELPDAHIVLVADAGRHAVLEQPAALARLVSEFLEGASL